MSFAKSSPDLPLQQLRSRSFELPSNGPNSSHEERQTYRAHFLEDSMPRARRLEFDAPVPPRPALSLRGYSFSKPSAATRRSIARSVSSFSLYSNFAGERFDIHHHVASRSNEASDNEKRKESALSSKSKFSLGDMEESKEDLSDDHQPTASVGKAMFMFLKAFIGSGVLFLPKAFHNGGLALSIFLMILIATVCLFAFLRLVKTQLQVGGSYGDMGGVLFGKTVRLIVLFFIVISQIGFVCSYFVFISGNLLNLADVLSSCRARLQQQTYIWFPLVAVIPLTLVRHIARLSFAAILADIFILFGLISVLYFTAQELHDHGVGPNIVAVNPSNFALMIGTATFSFEGIGLVIPIVESMKNPERFPLVVITGTIIVCAIYILIGSVSYLAYGDRIQAAVVYNFPPSHGLTIAAQLLYSIAIILTAPLMLFPALKILENGIFKDCVSGHKDLRTKWLKNLFRICLAIFCAVVAFAIGGDNLDKFVALVGSMACVPLCYIFPGLFHFKIAKNIPSKCFDIFLVILGTIIMLYTLYITIDSFVHPLTNNVPVSPYCAV